MAVAPGMLWGCSISPFCLRRAQEGVCLMPLKPFFGGPWGGRYFSRWQTKEISAEQQWVCAYARAGCSGGARATGGFVGPGRDAGRGGEQGCSGGAQPRAPPAPVPPCAAPLPPVPCHTPPTPKTTSKPRSAPYIFMGLAPTPLSAMLFGGGVIVPWQSPW